MADDSLYLNRGGDRTSAPPDAPVLVLLHGLGATAEVWDGLTALLPGAWPGPWIAPDLPGHGRSEPLPAYSFGGLAAEVARALRPEVAPGAPVAVLGHSLGGVVALTLGTGWFGLAPVAVAGLGIKIRWSSEDLTRAAETALRPPRAFAHRAEAADRALKLAGLAGLLPPTGPFTDAAVTPTEGGWRPVLDPAAFAVGAPDVDGLLRAARAAVTLAAGESDPMCPPEHMAALVPDPLVLPGLGHNAHVEAPAALLALVERLAVARPRA
ncbi:MAG TPA: alpha/beta hydrolase [Acidimicrobiia bacterium]|nr:alpha/beta hydrolase [Acidimicrobiia bacterium]